MLAQIEYLLTKLFSRNRIGDHCCPKGKERLWKYNQYEVPFDGFTLSGMKIRCTFTISTKPNPDPRLNVLENLLFDEMQLFDFLETYKSEFRRWMYETGRFFCITSLETVRITRQTVSGEIIDDIITSNALKEFKEKKFVKYGCQAWLVMLDVRFDRDDSKLIKENYFMIEDSVKESLKEQIRAKKIEEAWVVALLYERLKVQETWREQLHFGSNRTRKGLLFEVETESRDNEVIIKWKFNDPKAQDFHLRGFRREGAFALESDDESQGSLVIDRWGNDWIAERLEAGKAYFYTLKVSQMVGTGKPSDLRRELEQETLRLEVITAPAGYKDALEQKLERWMVRINTREAASIPKDGDKFDGLLNKLNHFVEFDDALTQRINFLIKEIESKNYPAKERKDKVERLKLIAEELRIEKGTAV